MGKQIEEGGRWCILRVASPRTLVLARSLADAGVEAWTPSERTQRRVPRRDRAEWQAAPLMPSYVFVRERHIDEMRLIERAEISAHPDFSIWRHMGNTLWVRHQSLHALRAEQQARYLATLPRQPHGRTKAYGEPYRPGDQLMMTKGSFAGLPCEVDASDGRTTSIVVTLFGRSTVAKIETSKLRADGIACAPSAARAARDERFGGDTSAAALVPTRPGADGRSGGSPKAS